MIKPEFSLLQMQLKGMLCEPVELGKPSFGKTPKRLNAVDMRNAPGEFIIAMIDAVMFIKANIDQAIVATPAMCMNHTGDIYFASDAFGAKVRLDGLKLAR